MEDYIKLAEELEATTDMVPVDGVSNLEKLASLLLLCKYAEAEEFDSEEMWKLACDKLAEENAATYLGISMLLSALEKQAGGSNG